MVGKKQPEMPPFSKFSMEANAATFYLAVSRHFIFATVLSKYNLILVLTVGERYNIKYCRKSAQLT